MAFPQATRSRLVTALGLVLAVALLGFALREPRWRPGDTFLRGSYDSLHALGGVQHSATDRSPVVIVYLDLPSFQARQLDPARPWPRALHAELVRRLTQAGARAVVFDIVFAAAGPDPGADAAFAAALREHGRVVLAREFNASSVAPDDRQTWARVSSAESLYEPFAQAAAAAGFAAQRIDDDYLVRRYFAGFTSEAQPSLTWAAASGLKLPVTTSSGAMLGANQRWLRYYGPALTIPHVSYGQALAPDGVAPDFFRGKIVLVGARPLVGGLNDRKDEFRNPFHSWQYRDYFMPGVEVHATEMLNLVRGDWLRRLPPPSERAVLLGVALVFGAGLLWLRPVTATYVALAGAGAALGLARAGFAHGVWFPWWIVAGAQIPAALGGSALFSSLEWYRARRRFEAAKRIADAKIREQAALLDKAHDAILVQGLDGAVTYANPGAERLYGWSFGELQNPDALTKLFSPEPDAVAHARAAALRDGEWNGELRQQKKNGDVVIGASRWTLLRDEAGQAAGLLLINRDITEQKQLEVQFLRTQRLNAIGTLAGGMAHDLNNALAPILMGTQLLKRKGGDAETRALLGLMETSTQRGADLVRQVLLFARGRGADFERLDVRPLVRELEKLVRETFSKSITVNSFLPADLWSVRGNPTQLHQILLNLCVNARDAMPAGGKLSFVADNVELDAAEAGTISDGRAGQFVSLLVSDTGTGMPSEVRAKIFEPFFSTKGEGQGTGIGLSTVLRLVKSHDGFLRVESELGQGTSFEVFLPRAAETVILEAAAPALARPRGQGELILVADDETAIRELVTAELTASGYRVLAAADGAAAVALFRQHAEEVRMLITDQSMPGLDGRQALAELRRIQPALPVILTSGDRATEPIAGVQWVSKPFALDELLVAIQRGLHPE